MIRRLTAMMVALALMLVSAGCVSMLEKEYLVITRYEDNSEEGPKDSQEGIRDYSSLRREIVALVEGHEEHGQLKFNNYSGNVSDDLSKACWEVKSTTALGAYSIDYISYELSRIVSYYEADIFITYKRSREEVEAIVSVSSNSKARDCLEEAMAAYERYLCIRMNTIITDADTMMGYIQEIYYKNPLKFTVLPEVQINTYPDSGMEKIFEFSFDYGFNPKKLMGMKDSLINAVTGYAARVKSDSPTLKVLEISSLLAEECLYDADLSSGKNTKSKTGKSLGATAYGALIQKAADSEGMAMAFLAICMVEGIECRVVRGRMDNIEHMWNMVKLGDAYYHVDVSQIKSRGIDASVLLSDEKISDHYWWDRTAYPASQGRLN